MSEPPTFSPEAVDAIASLWLARRDRGFTPSEQDAYLHWLRQDPRHASAVARLENAWGALNALSAWRPEHSPQPNPDLLVRSSRDSHARPLRYALLGAAAALIVGCAGWLWFSHAAVGGFGSDTHAHAHLATRTYDRHRLDDGTAVELNSGASMDVRFSAAERRVELSRGEVHFTVARDPLRPFVVRAGRVTIRAVGTAFNVRLQENGVEVLVTEGAVRCEEDSAVSQASTDNSLIIAGQRAVIVRSEQDLQTVVAPVSAEQISEALAWQPKRLVFEDTPLSEAIFSFNQHTQRHLVLGTPDLASLRIGGTFRADNVDAFVRLLETGFGLSVERRQDAIVLGLRP